MERFAANMKQAGVRCDRHIDDGQGHGFFNSNPSRTITLIEADKFLTSLGYLNGEPTIQVPVPGASSTEPPRKNRKPEKDE